MEYYKIKMLSKESLYKIKAMAIAMFCIWLGFLNPLFAQDLEPDLLHEDAEGLLKVDEDIFNVLITQDLENSTTGQYIKDEWFNDWNKPTWNNGLANIDIAEIDGNKVMRFNYPQGTWDPFDGGAQWLAKFQGGQKEVYFSYNVMFKPGFNWVLGGKLPGLGGGNNPGGGRDMLYDDGFSARIMWNRDDGGDGTMFFYVYHQDKPAYYGDVQQFQNAYWNVEEETWYNMTIRLVINSINQDKLTSDPHNAGNKDGILEFFLDGKLIYSRSNFRFRNIESIYVDSRHITSFFGGGDDSWGAARDEWAYFDDTYVFTYMEGVDVVRGYTPSAPGTVLQLPNMKGDVPDPADTEAPSIPGNVRLSKATGQSLEIAWDASTDNIFLKGYRVMLNGEEVGTTVGNSYVFSGLLPVTAYQISVSAYDASSNESQPSIVLNATTLDPDEEAPSVPDGLVASDLTEQSVIISWTASTDNVEVSEYRIYVDGNRIGSSVNPRFPIVDLAPSTSYSITVTALDAFFNESAESSALEIVTRAPDTEAPSVPAGVFSSLVTQNSIGLVWNPATDNVGVKEYGIYLNNSLLQTWSSNSFTITGLNSGIEYSISISAFDAAQNESPLSDPILVTTKNPDETSSPAMPDVAIVETKKIDSHASMKSTVNSFGHVELRDFGLQVSSDSDPTLNDKVIYATYENSVVIHPGRVKENLQVLYDFSSGIGSKVLDISDMGTPLDLIIKDRLTMDWLPGQGISVKGNTSIISEDLPVRLLDSLSKTNEITMEVWVRSLRIDQDGPARIFSLSKDNFNRAATLGFEGNNAYYNYIMRLNTTATDLNGTPEIATDHNFISLNLHHVVYTRSGNGDEKIFINSVDLKSGNRMGDFSSFSDDYKLSISNELGRERPWLGNFYLAAIYNRALGTEEIIENYLAGPGEIQYTLDIPLEQNTSYFVSPFARTDQGVVYGEVENLEIANVLTNPKVDSVYLAIYPNPSDGNFTIHVEYPNLGTPPVSLRVTDTNGRLVYYGELKETDEFVRMEVVIDKTPYFTSGIYEVMLLVGTKAIARRLIIHG